MATITSAIKSAFNHVAQGVGDAASGLWFESMPAPDKFIANAMALAGAGVILMASSGFEVAFGALLIVSSADDLRMAGRKMRLAASAPQPR